MTEPRIEDGVIEGGRVDGTLILHGIATSTIHVVEGGAAILHGIVNGDVRVDAGGKAEIFGTVNGTVYNHDADVSVLGMINGRVVDTGETKTRISDEAVVSG